MQLLAWEERFSVGIREFDQHHKILFEMINSLIIAKEENSGPEVLKNTLEQLHNYTIFHFAAEESMMEYFNCPGLEEHQVEHQELLADVQKYRDKFAQHELVEIDEVLNFVAGWWLDHTLGQDMLYGPYLKGKGD